MAALTPVTEVISRLLNDVKPIEGSESVSLDKALGRVLALDQVSTLNVPPADNSAMDGYALLVDPGQSWDEKKFLQVSQRVAAGSVGSELERGTVARIFTGAELPPGANSVIMQEQVEVQGGSVRLQRIPAVGENVRLAGQDIAIGQVVLRKGTRLGAAQLGLLASIGVGSVPVFRKLRVAVLTTGDELVEPGKQLAPGQIYNSNLYMLKGLIQAMGMEVIEQAVVSDDPLKTEQALTVAAIDSDCIVSSGGVSVGEEDYVKASVEKMGSLDIWRVNIKPGKPLAYGNVQGTPFFGLPGNPVSTFVTFCIMARPYLLKYQGLNDVLPTVYGLRSGFEYQGGSRQEYLRVRMTISPSGQVEVEKFQQQGSGILTSVSWASGLAVIDAGQCIEKGDLIGVLLMVDLVGS
jgi:molybdopterin molybdotransferase